MQVEVNQEWLELEPGATLASLLNQLKQPAEGIALAVNQTIIPQAEWSSHGLNQGDRIALFQAIAGG